MRRVMVLAAAIAAVLAITTGMAIAADPPQEVRVTPEYGTFLTSDNRLVDIQVPQNAYGDSFRLRYTQKTQGDFPLQPRDTIWVADPFTMEFRVDDGNVSLNNAATVTFRYNPAALGGRSEAALRLYRREANANTWLELPTTIDTARRQVTAQATESSDYGLAVSNIIPTAVPAPTATQVPPPPPTAAPPPTAVPVPTAVPAPPAPPEFKLGFKTLADIIPAIAGQPLENERHNALNGDGLQQTTTGLMVWRKADNWTAFTNGSRTWVNGPFGVMERSNEARFDWEAR